MEGIDRSAQVWKQFSLPGNVNLDGPDFATVVLAAGGCYLILATAILALTARRFDRIVGRAPQRHPIEVVNPVLAIG